MMRSLVVDLCFSVGSIVFALLIGVLLLVLAVKLVSFFFKPASSRKPPAYKVKLSFKEVPANKNKTMGFSQKDTDDVLFLLGFLAQKQQNILSAKEVEVCLLEAATMLSTSLEHTQRLASLLAAFGAYLINSQAEKSTGSTLDVMQELTIFAKSVVSNTVV